MAFYINLFSNVGTQYLTPINNISLSGIHIPITLKNETELVFNNKRTCYTPNNFPGVFPNITMNVKSKC